ncbi:hypothetical protein B0A48_00048 [Cryoendolithus antarcticus]|uniref:TLC domain-containing protein n=1 Tax=Cryoendolithus antarcticus TaxID=1507870 RepID=A0A1V8TTM2_9PEZI|nr:hypothetical protein B0A48_00048 [Cryoendolithus antarcticus]
MVVAPKRESFPPVAPITRQSSSGNVITASGTRRRRKSSTLGADPRGDTNSGALATRGEEIASLGSLSNSTSAKIDRLHPKSKRRKTRRVLRRAKRLALKHTWVLPLSLILLTLAIYAINPTPKNPVHYALFLAYPDPPLAERTNTLPAHLGPVKQYGKGPLDLAFVAFYTVVLTFTREFTMQLLLRPLAQYSGIRSRGKQARFMEQAYTALHFSVLGPLGLYVMYRTPVWYFNIEGMYAGFPHRAHEAVFKGYYLLQASYWAQQAIVLLLQLEKPRKDYKELVFHHVVTLILIALSYRFHFTYIGVAVYITMDISDFFLATSKVLNYIDSSLTAPYFTVFLFVWAYLRHYINLTILYSLLPGQAFSTVGPFELNWELEQYKCWISQVTTLVLLLGLQAVNCFWFYFVLRILWRILKSGEKKDDRSDEEDEEEANEIEAKEALEKPTLTLNGEPVSPVAEASGMEEKTKANGTKRR